MDDATKQLVNRGFKLTKLLIQKRFVPVQMDCQILFLFAALRGFLDPINTNSVVNYEDELYSYYNSSVYKYPLQGDY